MHSSCFLFLRGDDPWHEQEFVGIAYFKVTIVDSH